MRFFTMTAIAALPCILIASCVHKSATDSVSETVIITDFESPGDMNFISTNNASISQKNGKLFVGLETDKNLYAGITMRADTPWDWSEYDSFGIAMDIGNPDEHSVQLNFDVKDASGSSFTRSAVIPIGGAQTYYAELKGFDIDFDSGLRDNPAVWDFTGQKFIWMWGTKQLDTSAISQISVNAGSLNSNRNITLDNVRLVINPKIKKANVEGIVDQYGQNAKVSFPGKILSDAQLLAEKVAEEANLATGKLADRSQYGGWKNGPKRSATGYFRSEKVDGKWAMIDPEGYLFFSTGLANIRMSNTSTITGRDYPKESLTQRKPTDLTPEDSLGLNPAPESALPRRFDASDDRRDMFTWLPNADHSLSNHYGYRREVHTGPTKHGETYSFYSANLERKYGETSPASFMRDWRDNTLDRMQNWGFTSFGNWVDPMFYDNESVPYFANGWIIGDFKTVSSGDDFWAPLPDPFDPKFVERAHFTANAISEQVKASPWCIGVFIDNEKSWGRMGTVEGQYGIVINTMSIDGKDSPTKAVFTRLMREKYGTISKLNESWDTDIESWQAFDKGVTLNDHSQAKQDDYATMLEAYASEYFRIVSDAVHEVMPNHQYMGARFASWGMTPEVRRAAAKYADVMSYNEYKEVPRLSSWDFLEEIDKPSLIGEFHMGGISDTGMFHPGLVMSADQADRARMYKNYMNTVIDNPYFVGVHWFQYIDSPITGRAFDGENYNVGFVRVTDTPYDPMVEAAKEVNSNLYQRRFGQ